MTDWFSLAQDIAHGYRCSGSSHEDSDICPYCEEETTVEITTELGSSSVEVIRKCKHFDSYDRGEFSFWPGEEPDRDR